ncbi:MAG TPA: hypothetical protein VGD83_12670, partial [Streptosporangiaceae bacterium]
MMGEIDGQSAASSPVADPLPPDGQDDNNDDHDYNNCPDSDIHGVIPLNTRLKIRFVLPLAWRRKPPRVAAAAVEAASPWQISS